MPYTREYYNGSEGAIPSGTILTSDGNSLYANLAVNSVEIVPIIRNKIFGVRSTDLACDLKF